MTRNLYTGKWQSNCAAWNASADGAFVSSGANSAIMERFEASRLFSSLRISATFVRDGAVTYQFRVDAEPPFDGLVFTIDDTAVTPLVSKTDGWNEATFQVAAGAHAFSWDYTKDYSGDEGADKAFVKVIELVGTSFSDTACHPCGGDMTMSGGSICKFCGANEYAAAKSHSELDFACYKCPTGTVAPKGSIGLGACVDKRACTAEDLVEAFTPCVAGRRNASFAWSEPRTCDTTLPDSLALPATKSGLACDTCVPGFVLNAAATCERCPPGQKLSDDDDTCTKCPAGHVVVNAMAFGDGTRDGWSAWPSVVDSVSAVKAGWKLTQKGIAFAAHSASDDGAWNRPSRFALPFNATFTHSGFVNITYTLSHVPTFESAGVRAWLELEIQDSDASAPLKKQQKKDTTAGSDDKDDNDDDDDDDEDDDDGVPLGGDVGGNIAHLSHGGENGTFTQVIHFNVTTKTTKLFTLVLRTTSPAAERLTHAKVLHLGLFGTEDGGPVACGACPPGYEAFAAASDSDGDGENDTTAPMCRLCPAGTFARTKNGATSCEKCPANTFSSAGAADACEPCGSNTYSVAGAQTCAAPSILKANAPSASTAGSSSAAATVVAGSNGLDPSYDLSLLESLIWGNDSFFSGDTNADLTGPETLLSASSVLPSGAVRVDSSRVVFLGLFRPVDKSWKDEVTGQIVDELVDAARDRPYVVELTMLNPRDAGHFFTQKTNRYGDVECAAPAVRPACSCCVLSDGGMGRMPYQGCCWCRCGCRSTLAMESEQWRRSDGDRTSRERRRRSGAVHWRVQVPQWESVDDTSELCVRPACGHDCGANVGVPRRRVVQDNGDMEDRVRVSSVRSALL